MKAIQLFSLASFSLLIMSNSCEKGTNDDVTPLASGRIVRIQMTIDDAGYNPRPRWQVNVAPLSFPGLNGTAYQEIKTFSLSDTAAYRAGTSIQFHYQLVPQAQHTPWRTLYERLNTAAGIAWGDRLPELTLTDVQVAAHQ